MSNDDVTRLLAGASAGDPQAREQLAPLIYEELRAIAARALHRERREHTLGATALVHEAWLRLIDQRVAQWRHRGHFFGVAAEMMRRILIDHARARLAAKRGGAFERVALDDILDENAARGVDLLELDEALTKLAALDAQQSRIVEMRYFAGLTTEEVAELLGLSPATVKRDWATARAWLAREIGP